MNRSLVSYVGCRIQRRAVVCLTVLTLLGAAAANEPSSKPKIGVGGLAFSPDGKLLAACGGGSESSGLVTLWDVATRKVLWSQPQSHGVAAVQFSADGRTLAIGMWGPLAKILDVASGRIIRELEGTGYIAAVAFVSGETLATGGSERTIRLWDLASGKVTVTFEGHTDQVYSLAASSDGKRLVSGSGDGSARLWDVAEKKARHVFAPNSSLVRRVGFSRDGRCCFACRWDSTVRVYELATQRTRVLIRWVPDCAALSPDDGLLAVASRSQELKLYRVQLGAPDNAAKQRIARLIDQWRDDNYAVREAASRELEKMGMLAEPQLAEVMRSPDAEMRIRARRVRDKVISPEAVATLAGHADEVRFVCFSPDGKLLASGDRSGAVKLWDVARRAEVTTLRLSGSRE